MGENVMKLMSVKNAVLASAIGVITLGGAEMVNAQADEYRDWQRAQREAQQEYREYQRRPTRENRREYQQAQREAQREYNDYLRERNQNVRNNRRVYNNRANVNSRYYRVYRDGRYYQVDNRGAELLRQAVNQGYQQGYREGQNDARYRRNSGYYGSNIYRQGTYGYQSYVDRSQYQYYFQQGFQRGYEDGYNNSTRYGYRSNNGINILGTILNGILNITSN